MGKYDKYKESVFTHEEMQPMKVEYDPALEDETTLIVHAKYLMQRLLEYREALYPFIKSADMLEKYDTVNALDTVTCTLQVGDIRKAREVYGKLIPPISEDKKYQLVRKSDNRNA